MNIAQHRRDRDQAATLAITVVCGLGFAGGVSPTVEDAVGAALLVLAALAVLVVLVVAVARGVARRLRERREDRADALAGAAWRAQHLPHLAAPLDGAGARREWSGVAR